MADGQKGRRLKPRSRGHRALRDLANDPQAPRTPLPAPVHGEEGWFIAPPLSSRLHQKSAIGRPIEGGGIVLQPAEVMFCHWHRHIPLPSSTWIDEMLADDPGFMHQAAAFEESRDGGERIVLRASLSRSTAEVCAEKTWAMRWRRDEHPSSSEPMAQMRWTMSIDSIDWRELLVWVRQVRAVDHLAEILVVDGEFDVTAYRLDLVDPLGTLPRPADLIEDAAIMVRRGWNRRTAAGSGHLLPIPWQEWPLGTVGVPQMDGTWVDEVQGVWLEQGMAAQGDGLDALLDDLLGRGLLLRPGFKYGCRWRIYESPMGEEHAPWLLSPLSEAPETWDGACLAARLAAGVHKQWICSIPDSDSWVHLNISRVLLGRD